MNLWVYAQNLQFDPLPLQSGTKEYSFRYFMHLLRELFTPQMCLKAVTASVFKTLKFIPWITNLYLI